MKLSTDTTMTDTTLTIPNSVLTIVPTIPINNMEMCFLTPLTHNHDLVHLRTRLGCLIHTDNLYLAIPNRRQCARWTTCIRTLTQT